MGRPTTIQDQQILAAARAVFLEHGASATTADVAQRAGVAPGTIFKRFKSKAGLFEAAMRLDFGEPRWLRSITQRWDANDARGTLHIVGVEMINFFRELMPTMMMRWSSGTQFGFPEELKSPGALPIRALQHLAAYLERQMEKNRLRKQDPEILARIFVGSIQSFVFFELLGRLHQLLPMTVDQYLAGVIEILWRGTSPKARKRKKER
jgi:AcrR family transcriptional regulator